MRQRTCVFCGSAPLTKEHVYRKKLRDIVDSATLVYTKADFLTGAQRKLPEGMTPFTEATVRRVCKRCNNGWMNQADVRIEGLLDKLINGHSMTLSKNDSRALATWASKTAMMRSFMEPQDSVTHNDLQRMFHSRKPPADWRCYLGATDERGLADRFDWYTGQVHRVGHQSAVPPESPEIFVSQHSMVLGKMLVTTIGVDGTAPILDITRIIRETVEPQTAAHLVQLWPNPREVAFDAQRSSPGHEFAPLTQVVQLLQSGT